jgi:hypothetical protein
LSAVPSGLSAVRTMISSPPNRSAEDSSTANFGRSVSRLSRRRRARA